MFGSTLFFTYMQLIIVSSGSLIRTLSSLEATEISLQKKHLENFDHRNDALLAFGLRN